MCEAPEAGSSPRQQQQGVAVGGHAQRGGSKAGLAAEGPAVTAVVPTAAAPLERLQQQKWYQQAAAHGVRVISHKWLMDSVAAFSLKPVEQYVL